MHNELTKQDIQKMREELDYRRNELMPEQLEEVKRTRAFGDLSENFEYKAAKQALNRNKGRIRYLDNMMKTARVIDDRSAADEVGLFDKVEIYIPEDNETLLGRIRDILTKGEIEAVITDVKKTDIEWIEDRKLRSAGYRELLSHPHPATLLPLIKGISKKNAELSEIGKKLAAADKDAFESSLRYVREEIAFALGIGVNEANQYIENALGFFPSIA